MKRIKALQAVLVTCMAVVGANLLPAADGTAGTNGPAESTSLLAAPSGVAVSNDAMALQVPSAEPQKEELVSFNVVDTELAEIVKTFTRLPGVNIVIGTNITGKVTASLQNVPWRTALDSILSQRGLRLEDSEKSGVFTIVPKTGVDPLVTETIFLKYAEVPSVINVLKTQLDARGKIADFSSRNAMVIQSTQRNLTEIRAIVDQIDIPRRQVFIEAQFVELSSSSESNIGVGWANMLKAYEIGGTAQILNSSETITRTDSKLGTLTKSSGRDGSDTFNGTYDVKGATLKPTDRTRTIKDDITKSALADGTLSALSDRTFSDVRTAVLNPLQLNFVLSALKSRGGTTILSKPKIIVANGEQAMIHIGEERRPFIATVSPATQTTAPFTTYNPGEAVQFGVKIVVTPTINTGSNITVSIEPELTRLAGMDTAPDGKTSYPIKATKKIKTQFTLENYRTAAIGGLTETSDSKGSDKVPLLSDLPLLGKYLFSRESDSRKQQEMIIFVTVGIVSPEAADEKTGVPSEAELIRSYKLDKGAEAEKFQNEMERKQADAEKRTEKAEKRKKLILNRIK